MILKLPELNINDLAKKLNIDDRGATEGHQNRPDSDAASYDQNESDIIHAIQQYASEAVKQANKAGEQLMEDMDRIEADIDKNRCEEIPEIAQTRINEALESHRQEVKKRSEEFRQARQDRKLFTYKHQITHTAQYADSSILHNGIMFAIVVCSCATTCVSCSMVQRSVAAAAAKLANASCVCATSKQ